MAQVPTGASFPLQEACEMLKSKNHVDFILTCEGCKFPVHRILLYQKSPFFRAAFDHEFKEKSEGHMNIGDTTPEALAAAIIFCYSDKLAPTAIQDAFPDVPRETDIARHSVQRECFMEIYLLADRLLLPALAKKAAIAFVGHIKFVTTKDLQKFLTETYHRLPIGDENLKPLVTAWAIYKFSLLEDKKMGAVRDLILEEDHGGFVAASFMSLKSRGLLNEEVASNILTGSLWTTEAGEEPQKDPN